jgi:hypothetical protein
MVMHLNGQFGAGFDSNTFYLVSAPDIDAVIRSPGSEHFSVGDVLSPVSGFEFFYNGLDMLGLVLGVRFFGSFRCI